MNPFEKRLSKPVTAKHAILAALAATGTPLSTTRLMQCGELFGVDAAAVRVALGRLVRNHDVVSIKRGVHTLGDKGKPILNAIRRWIDLPKHVRPWNEAWITIHTAHLGRTKRTVLRRRERAMSLFGFAPLESGFWIRPDNLTLPSEDLRTRLIDLGLEPEAWIFANALQTDLNSRMDTLWNRDNIEAGYRAAQETMDQCIASRPTIPNAPFAAQAAQIGLAVIGMLSFDPLLPEALVNTALRNDVHQTMIELDRHGKEALVAFWQERNE